MMPSDRVSVDGTIFTDAMARSSILMSRGLRTTLEVSMMRVMTTDEMTSMLIGGVGDGVVHPVYGRSFMCLLLDSE
jgi:hypothetical protein